MEQKYFPTTIIKSTKENMKNYVKGKNFNKSFHVMIFLNRKKRVTLNRDHSKIT